MYRKNLKEILIHPLFLSLFLWTIITGLLPPLFHKYKIIKIKEEYTSDKNRIYFDDVDQDGTSEKLHFDYHDLLQTKLIISRQDRVIEQYNLKYQPNGFKPIFFGDYNHDGYRECFITTISDDSIFLNIIDPLLKKEFVVSERVVDVRYKNPQSNDMPVINSIGLIPGTEHNTDFVFFIITGYSKKPRALYRYIIDQDSLIKSPESSAVITDCQINDINSDSLPEFILNINANGNCRENAPYTDMYSWLMVLDNNLDFLFPPVKLSKYPSRLLLLPLKLKDYTRLVALQDYNGTGKDYPALFLFDTKGRLLQSKPVKDIVNPISWILKSEKDNTFYFIKNRMGEVEELDTTFSVINSFSIPPVESGEPMAVYDLNQDGKMEYIFQGEHKNSIIISQSDLSSPVSFPLSNYQYFFNISEVNNKGEKTQIFIQCNESGCYLRFFRNPWFYVKYPFYTGIFLAVYLLILLITRIQQYRSDLLKQKGRNMADLQVKAIKNQLDPHFTLNILNAIGNLYASEKNREKADYIFGKYAKMIRQTVISSDKIIVSLSEEIDFVKNYLELERFRSKDSFDYTIETAQDVDLCLKVPRMLIHTFAENAVKYGIPDDHSKRKIRISLTHKKNYVEITIEDNGPGINSNGTSKNGTGKGLHILNELIELFYWLEKVRITYSFQNEAGSGRWESGTRAVVKIKI